MSKPRVVKDYDKIDDAVKEQIKLKYPSGFEGHLVTFQNKEGKMVSALPFETEEVYYLIRMTVREAQSIIEDDDDYDDEGFLKDEVREEYEEKYDDAEDEDDEDDEPAEEYDDDDDDDI
jgi:parvulin-like peptidyl-prolyl isomerase